VVEAHQRVKSHREQDHGPVLGQQRVGERQKRVERVLRRTAAARGVVEGQRRIAFQHRLEGREVELRGAAFASQELLEVGGLLGAAYLAAQLLQDDLFGLAVAAQQDAAVVDLGGDQSAGEVERALAVAGGLELGRAQLDVRCSC
jgi:hypothetical protein